MNMQRIRGLRKVYMDMENPLFSDEIVNLSKRKGAVK